MMNASLPTMVDSGTRLDRVTYESDSWQFFHTLINSSVDDLDVDIFERLMRSEIATNLCSDKELRSDLEKGGVFTYSYSDRNGSHITDIIVTKSECQ